MKDVIFINSHPIQYFAPLYKYMNENGVRTEAWYLSDKSIAGKFDVQFGVNVKWDIPILEGYPYTFFKNNSFAGADAGGFFSLMNFGVLKALRKAPKSLIVVHGWHYFTNLMVIFLGKTFGHTVCIRCEMPQNQELLKTGWKMRLKKAWLKYFVFPRSNYFLYIGSQNKAFYESYGIPGNRLVFCPYSVDNTRFTNEKLSLKPNEAGLRAGLGIGAGDKVILYSGKYIDKKRPMDLLQAFAQMRRPDCWLVMLGEGSLRPQMEEYIAKNNLANVILTGFVNQSQVSEYYAISNLFVMCSTIGETWGLSINEAMNFDMPVIVSDHTGSAFDLVKNGDNGYIFKTGDVNDLAGKLEKALYQDSLAMQTKPADILKVYSYATITRNIKTLIQ